jgi:DNA-binding transcriptional LysR family regulator
VIEEIGGDFLQWLRGFYYVARRQSVTRASLEMRRNQSTISHQIKCLENEFGVTLFDRSRGKMDLTPEGKGFLDKAISVFEIIKEMKGEISKGYLETRGKVIIAASHSIIHYFLPRYIVQFRKESPNVNFELEGGGVEMILERVESAEVDFGIASLNAVPDGIIYHDLFETGLRLLAPKDNSFFSGQELTLEQIARAPFIFFPHHSTITPLIERVFAKNHLKLNVVLVLNNFESVKKYVSLGTGISILDDYALTEKDKDKIHIYPLDRFFGRRIYGLILRKQKYLSPPAKVFLHSIKPDILFK